MKKVIEINIGREDFKKYLEECLIEENIDYEMKIEGRWTQYFKQASKYYEVYCLYVNNNDSVKVGEFVKDFENAPVITDDIEELKNVEEEENDDKFKTFTQKNFLKYYWGAIIIIGILIILGIKFSS